MGKLSIKSILFFKGFNSFSIIFSLLLERELYHMFNGPVGCSCRKQRLLLCRGVRPPKECPEYGTKQSEYEVPVILELWEMRSTPSLPSFPGPRRPRVVKPNRVLSVGQIELNCVLMLNLIT